MRGRRNIRLRALRRHRFRIREGLECRCGTSLATVPPSRSSRPTGLSQALAEFTERTTRSADFEQVVVESLYRTDARVRALSGRRHHDLRCSECRDTGWYSLQPANDLCEWRARVRLPLASKLQIRVADFHCGVRRASGPGTLRAAGMPRPLPSEPFVARTDSRCRGRESAAGPVRPRERHRGRLVERDSIQIALRTHSPNCVRVPIGPGEKICSLGYPDA